MKLKYATIGLVSAAALVGPWAVTTASAQDGVFIPTLSYRTGPYAPSGIPIANGFKDYYTLLNEANEPDCVGKMKQFATYFTHGVRNGSKLRVAIYGKKTPREILDVVDAFFTAPQPDVAPENETHFPAESCALEETAA